jgi:PAS domain S-box-containing protein
MISTKVCVFLVIWSIGCGLTISAYFLIDGYYKREITQRSEILIDQAVELIKARFQKYEYGLLSSRGVLLSSVNDDISQPDFERYVEAVNLDKDLPGARGLGFIRKVPVSQENDFVMQVRATGNTNYKIRTIAAHDKDRFIIQYIYPERDNEQAIGLDIGSERYRREAAISASLLDQAILTPPITLVQAEEKAQSGFLILLPVYDDSVRSRIVENRLESTVGWVYAPLVADDVLFDLGPKISEIDFSITDKNEAVSFYNSTLGQETITHNSELTSYREIAFMGRNWVIAARAHQAKNQGVLSYSPVWFLFLFMLMTSLSYFITLVLVSKYSEKSALQSQKSNVSLSVFFSTRGFVNVFKGYVFMILSILAFSGYLYVEKGFNVSSELLNKHAQYSKELINNHAKSYKESLLFIKSTPVIKAVTNNGFANPSLPFELNNWKPVLADIFKAYMLSQKEIFQIRLISAKGLGMELVRVERKGHDVVITPESELQNKGHRDYFTNTLKLDNNQIYTSTIEPNVEEGVMELPIRLTRRYSTPLYYGDGSPFAILVINIEATPLLEDIRQISNVGETIYITNSEDQFIVANEDFDVNASSLKENYRWADFFQRSSNIFSALNQNISAWKNKNGSFISAEALVLPNSGQVVGQLNIRPTLSTKTIFKDAIILLVKQMLIIFAFSILSLLLFYYSWANNTRMVITARVKKELDAQKQKDNMFESLTELSPEAMVIIDTTGTIVLINSQAEKLFGYHREQLVGQKINILLPRSVEHKHDSYVKSYLDQPLTRAMGMASHLSSRHANGSEFPVEVSLSPIQLDDKLLIASSIRNISERRDSERKLKQAIEKAESASQAKTTFLANMSHEIRTPLNAVIGLTHLLKADELSADQFKLVSHIQLAGKSLLAIVNDILDLTKIEANEMVVVQAPFDLPQLLNDIYSLFSSQAEQKAIALSIQLDPDLPRIVDCDKKLLQQIITNLLSNAIKFTNEGRITLKATRVSEESVEPDQHLVRFSIEDTGIGIAPGQHVKIFQAFNQAEEGINRRFEGTGLGLSIVDHLTKLLDGKVGVDSELGKGSTFWVELPLAQVKAGETDGKPRDKVLNVWFCGDCSESQSELKKIGLSLGWKVCCTSSFDMFNQEYQLRLHQQKSLPDVMLMDWEACQLDSLPRLDQISKIPGWRSIPVIAVCSTKQQLNIEQHNDAERFQASILKPINLRELFNTIHTTLIPYTGDSTRVLESTKMEAIKAKWLPDVSILVVDDSQMNLDVVERILTKNGALVTTARCASDAIDILKNGAVDFDVVLMDVQMPVMDGIEATFVIRQQLNIKKLPILALTAGTLEDEKNRALNIGMDAFLSKPIEPEKLVLSLRRHVENYREQAVMIEYIDPLDKVEATSDWPEIIGITNSIDRFQGDLNLFEFTLRRLFDEYRDIDSGIDEMDLSDHDTRLMLASRLHKLRGNAGMVGATELSHLTSQAELGLRNGEEDNQAERLREVVSELKQLEKNSQHVLENLTQKKRQINSEAESHIEAMNKSEVEQLIIALQNNDLSASEIVETNEPRIRAFMGDTAFVTLNHEVQTLNYVKAAEILTSYLCTGD